MIRATSAGVVYSEPDVYAGWPANHGAWQWGREWLVGFLRGAYVRQSMHNIRPPYEYCFARSLDDGLTWTVEPHGQEFVAGVVHHPAPAFNFATTIRRVCGVYDHGGDETDNCGGFFLSRDRGRSWHGPYVFSGLESIFDGSCQICTARQAELPARHLIFLSRAARHHWGTDNIFAAEHDGERFHELSDLPFGAGRAVMPAVAEHGGRIVVAARRRDGTKMDGWVEALHSDDGGRTWSVRHLVGSTGTNNGNPPALIHDGHRFLCAFGNRRKGAIMVSESVDGESWSEPDGVAFGSRSSSGYFDLGYPRMLQRESGKVVVIYYIATRQYPEQHIVWTAL